MTSDCGPDPSMQNHRGIREYLLCENIIFAQDDMVGNKNVYYFKRESPVHHHAHLKCNINAIQAIKGLRVFQWAWSNMLILEHSNENT